MTIEQSEAQDQPLSKVKVTKTAKAINSLYIGTIARENCYLQANQKYSIMIDGIPIENITGTLTNSYYLGGLSPLYKRFDLHDGDEIEIEYKDGFIHLVPPSDKLNKQTPEQDVGEQDTVGQTDNTTHFPEELTVFGKKQLRHIHIEAYSPGNLARWTPRTEGDVYMVFGALSEYTDYRYCCGTNQDLLKQLRYSASAKPDAILIDRNTNEYLIAELKMKASAFTSNHNKEDIDVLICWEDDAKIKDSLPSKVVVLRDVLEKAIEAKEIEL